MKSITPLLLAILVSFQFSCEKKKSPLEQAKIKITESTFISYDEESYWPNPVNPAELIDTSKSHNDFRINSHNFIGYDFIMTSDGYDMTFIDGKYRFIDHTDSLIEVYIPLKPEGNEEFKRNVNRLNVRWSPIIFLTQEWEFLKDTTIMEQSLADYFQIEIDTILDGEKVYVERHLYINKETTLVDKFDRISYKEDGSIDQQVSKIFSNYNVLKDSSQLSYEDPINYMSTYGRKKRMELLKSGKTAPEFALTDINGDTIRLSNLRGKKVLLDFSVINCSYCMKALEHINNCDFELTNDVQLLYINPHDSKKRMTSYMKKVEVPFPVLADAKKIGEQYGVNGFPTFFLINEDGIIEKVQSGYSESFINTFKM